MKKILSRECINLIKEIVKTPYSALLKEIRDQDYQDKKELIAAIDTFQKIYKKHAIQETKNIIISLIEDLEEVNTRIKRIENYGAA